MNSTISGGLGARSGGFWQWNSPMPYLFGGLAAMLTVVTVALVILACSYRKSLSRLEDEEKPKPKAVESPQSEPKIVVIMAGDQNPSFIAKPNPLSFPCNCSCDSQSHPPI